MKQRLFIFFTLMAVFSFMLPAHSLATDYTSTNFFVRDPSMNQGGTSNATSTNFQLRGSVGERAEGRSTSTNFAGESGFQYYNDIPSYVQSGYRFGINQNSTSISYSGAPAQNTVYTITTTGQAFRLRLLIQVNLGQISASEQAFKLQFADKTGATCAGLTYSDVATASGVIRYNDNSTPADGANLTAVAGDPTNGGDTIRNQTYEEANNFTNSTSPVLAGEDGMWDFSLVNNSSVGSKHYCFRAVKSDGTVLTTYSQYPEIIIDEELAFSLDASSKNFGLITPGSAPTDQTTTTTTTTNAAGGYQVTLWQTQLLTSGSATVANWTGTNTSPTTLSGTGASAFGYTTNDSNLGGGTANRFTSAANLFAGFALSGPGDPVADNTTTPVASDNFSITYRLRTGPVQQSGLYSSTLVYICTATY